jgi:hypothetical protein
MWHKSYWSCSSFADWLRGTAKPESADSRGWREWKKLARATYPARYWLAEEGLSYLQDVIYYIPSKINDVRYYLNNRFVIKTHCLVAHPRDVKPGAYSELGMLMLPALFNGLVDFVEIRKAWMHVIWADKEKCKEYGFHWYHRRPFKWFSVWRSREAGLAYLDWEIGLKWDESSGLSPDDKRFGQPTHQSVAAQELKDLYLWWTEVYPNRPDPYQASGWSALCDKRREKNPDSILIEDDTDTERTETNTTMDRLRDLEQQYDQEDEEMLIRLIKLRQNLWT